MVLKIDKQEAKKLYPDAPSWFQEKLESEFGEDCFKEKSFEDFKNFDDACKELDLNPQAVYYKEGTPDEIAYKKLKIVVQAINQDWTPDWTNSNQRKWWPYFVLSSGFGFSFTDFGYDFAYSFVGSRLCFESQEKAIYAGKQFLNLYKEFLT